VDAEAAGPEALTPRATAIIAEDEEVLRHELRTRLAALWPSLEVVAAVGSGPEALASFERHRPTLMFLDIQMPGLTGLEVAQQVGDLCHVVFVTAYDSHAVAAFEHGAVDYVLKPYDTARLGQTIRRVQKRLSAPPPSLTDALKEIAASARQKPHLNWIKASVGAEVNLIMVRDVCYFRADAKYTTVVTADRDYVIRRSIKDLAETLDPSLFWQIHRSTIVNVEAIASVTRSMAGATLLKLRRRPERLTVSEAYRHLFRQM
jgi:DNA-binding LytR/AlgR family response regulator